MFDDDRGKARCRGEIPQSKLQGRPEFQREVQSVDVEDNRHVAKIAASFFPRHDPTRYSEPSLLRSARVHPHSLQHVHRPGDQGLLQSAEARQRAQFLHDGGDEVLRFHRPRG